MNNKCVQDAIEISQAGYWAVTGTGYLMTNWGEGQDSDIEGQRCRLLLCLQSLSHYRGFFFFVFYGLCPWTVHWVWWLNWVRARWFSIRSLWESPEDKKIKLQGIFSNLKIVFFFFLFCLFVLCNEVNLYEMSSTNHKCTVWWIPTDVHTHVTYIASKIEKWR